MWKVACYLIGALCAALASVCAWSAQFARFEDAGDLERFEFNAIINGGLFALALALLCTPLLSKGPRWRYVLLAVCAGLV
jgi:hypothetical protein